MIRAPAVTLLMLIALILGSCSDGGTDAISSIATEIYRLRDATTPPRAQAIGFSAPKKEGILLRSSWDFDTDMTWEAYCGWLREGLDAKFEMTLRTAESIRFAQVAEGDTYSVEARVASSTTPLRVRVIFRAYSN